MIHDHSNPNFDMKAFERRLRREKLLNTREIEFLGTKFDFASSASAAGGTFLFPTLEVTLGDGPELSSFLFRAATDDEFKSAVLKHPLKCIETSGRVFGGGAWDLKHSQLMALLAKGHFNSGEIIGREKQNDQHLFKTVAYLTSKGATKEWELEQLYPYLPYRRFQMLQARVYAEVERTLPKNSRRFLKVLENMTEAQREALYAFHLNNPEELTRPQVAENLGISIDSLQDRIDSAMRKIKAEFKELTPSKSKRPPYWKNLFKLPDLRLDGIFRRSEGKRVRPLFRVDSRTGEKTEIAAPGRPAKTTPISNIRELRQWARVTGYKPRHDGVMSPKYAHMKNGFLDSAKLKLVDEGRTHVSFVSGDPETAYRDQRSQNSAARTRKKMVRDESQGTGVIREAAGKPFRPGLKLRKKKPKPIRGFWRNTRHEA